MFNDKEFFTKEQPFALLPFAAYCEKHKELMKTFNIYREGQKHLIALLYALEQIMQYFDVSNISSIGVSSRIEYGLLLLSCTSRLGKNDT
jgi:hypothetical protein